MNIEIRKLNLIHWLSKLNDEAILQKIENIQNENSSEWEKLSTDEKLAIEEGVQQLDNGEFFTHEDVRDKIREKFNF